MRARKFANSLSGDNKMNMATSKKVPHGIAGLVSLIIPGLGQMIIGEVGRGFILFSSMLSIIVMFIWRIELLAHLQPDIILKFTKALSLKPVFIVSMCIGITGLWLWIAWDA